LVIILNIDLTGKGKLKITGNAEIGPAYIGRYHRSNPSYAQFSHKDKTGGAEYALLQESSGTTLLNSFTGRPLIRHKNR